MILIDSSHMLFRNLYMNLDSIKQDYRFLNHLLLQNFLSFARDFGASKKNRVIIAVDGKSTWRKKYFEENAKQFKVYRDQKKQGYKGQRERSTDIDWDTVFEQYNKLLDILDNYTDFEVIKVDEVEADDIIYVATKVFQDDRIIIVSSDKDFQQLLDYPRVIQYDPVKRIFKPRLNSKKFLLKHIILGDKVDNILPLKKGVGEKRAEKWLSTIEDDLKTNRELKEQFMFNKKLIDLSELPEKYFKRIESELKKSKNNTFNPKTLGSLLKEDLGLNKMLERMSELRLSSYEKPSKKVDKFLKELDDSSSDLSPAITSLFD